MLLDTQFIVQLILSAENELDQNMDFFLIHPTGRVWFRSLNAGLEVYFRAGRIIFVE